MKKEELIYTSLCVFFSVFIITGNLIYQKFVFLPILSFYTFELSIGAIIYPFTFLITDLITEFYGKEKANFCVKLAIVMNILIVFIIMGMDQLEATTWSKVNNTIFHTVFGYYSIAFLSSIIACYIAQTIDIIIYLWIKKLTKNKWLWVRNNGSTCISLFIDTCIVVTFMTIFHVIPPDQMWSLILNSYFFKLFFSVSSTPLFYLFVKMIKQIQKNTAHPGVLSRNHPKVG